MYRRSKKYQQLRSRVASAIAARERKRLKGGIEAEPSYELPDLRKMIDQ